MMLRGEAPNFLPYQQGYELACKKLGFKNKKPDILQHVIFLINTIHPLSSSIELTNGRLFSVVTPVLNGEQFISTTLESILSQQGDFFIDYLVKDAVSTDGTLSILKEYGQRINSGSYPIRCSGIRFRVVSMADNGLYDALKYAFEQDTWRNDTKTTIQTYLNADDVMSQGVFSTVAHVFDSTPARWVCGQTHVINEMGRVLVTPQFPLTFAREDIADGFHDGRSLYTIQQEGTFWLQELYKSAGGIDNRYKLAGDYDLWRRFSNYCELLALDKPLASFRSHQKQLSKQINQYHAEVDKSLSLYPSPTAVTGSKQHFYIGAKAPEKAIEQRPGPVGFLDAEGRLREIAYIKRGWLGW